MGEEGAHVLADGFQAALATGITDSLEDVALELAHFQAWGDAPDVADGDGGEFAAQFSGHADTAAQGGDLVAEVQPKVEAGVGEFPDAVDTVGSFGLTEDIFELDLELDKDKFEVILVSIPASRILLHNYDHLKDHMMTGSKLPAPFSLITTLVSALLALILIIVVNVVKICRKKGWTVTKWNYEEEEKAAGEESFKIEEGRQQQIIDDSDGYKWLGSLAIRAFNYFR